MVFDSGMERSIGKTRTAPVAISCLTSTAMRQGGQYIGSKITSTGLIAKIGKYLLVITEKDEALTEFDYTLIPLHAKVQIRYN